ncbi:10 kDa heat shock protein, mitochondrial [Bagarius yarrelli]|uniref:10 kDa heat shock protein, mitochondrial n=1 Tax=Bagarius yarrelli TaxID=175774 RepID=A0A556V4N3_BAGYA|nr:10 kDa heat shock protein, mitochondrial [Bagarius yarrelli]
MRPHQAPRASRSRVTRSSATSSWQQAPDVRTGRLALEPAKAFRKFLPMFDRVLVERLAAETVSKGGIMIPEKSQGKVLQATVVAVGPGTTNKDYYLFRDADILGKYVE